MVVMRGRNIMRMARGICIKCHQRRCGADQQRVGAVVMVMVVSVRMRMIVVVTMAVVVIVRVNGCPRQIVGHAECFVAA